MRESTVETALVRAAESAGGRSVKLGGVIGLPDRLVLLPGARAVFVELKRPGARPRRSQRWWHEQLARLGFPVRVVDCPEQAREVCGV